MSYPRAAVLVYNPVAGKIQSRPTLIPKIVEELRGSLGSVDLMPTTGPRTAGAIARQAIDGGARLVCVAGGDGTVNEVIEGVAGTGIPLAVFPAGTANVLGTETGLGGNALRVARNYSSLVAQDIALGSICHPGGTPLYFSCMAGAGLDARIVRLVSPSFKRRFGKLSYWEGGFAQVGKRLPEFDVVVDGRSYRASFALISRVRNYGGDLEIARHANLLSDDFAVVLFEGPSSLRYLKYFSGVLLNRLEGMRGVTLAHARTVEILGSAVPIDVQVDGEHAGYAPVRLEIASVRLSLMVPPAFVAAMGAR